MKYRVLGRRVLLKVKKYTKETKFEGTTILMPEDITDQETATQTTGEVVGLGELAFLNDDGTMLGGQSKPIKLGDMVHFQRYGAIRLNAKKHLAEEFWVVEDKDLFAVEKVKEEVRANVK